MQGTGLHPLPTRREKIVLLYFTPLSCAMDQLAPAALGALLQTHAVLRERAEKLAGSPELARAYRAWAALTSLRRQVDWLGLHLQQWRTEQLEEETWLTEAKQVLIRMQAERARLQQRQPEPEPAGVRRLVAMGFTREASVEALQGADGSVAQAADVLLAEAEQAGLQSCLSSACFMSTSDGGSPAPTPAPAAGATVPATPRTNNPWAAVKARRGTRRIKNPAEEAAPVAPG